MCQIGADVHLFKKAICAIKSLIPEDRLVQADVVIGAQHMTMDGRQGRPLFFGGRENRIAFHGACSSPAEGRFHFRRYVSEVMRGRRAAEMGLP
jgi:hypothetical protein